MTDWAAWGTSVGTLVLAGATFAAVRSSNRSARIAERALLAGLRPALTTPRRNDQQVEVQFADGRVFDTGWGDALVRAEDGVIGDPAPQPATFTEQQRDLYIAAGELGHWQAALPDPTSEPSTTTSEALTRPARITADLLYR